MSYERDRAWSDQFLPEIRRIVGPHLLIASPDEIDMKQAADLIVLRARDMTVACRIRREGYAERYPWEFTIRSKRDSGAKTEFDKLTDGWCDWMFYGHEGASPGSIRSWLLLDMSVWRRTFIRLGALTSAGRDTPKSLFQCQSNGDGTHFYAFDVRRFPKSMVIAASHNVPYPQEPRDFGTSQQALGY